MFIYTRQVTRKKVFVGLVDEWRSMNNVTQVVEWNGTKEDARIEVDIYVIQLMRVIGCDNVRGGTYSDDVLSSADREAIDSRINYIEQQRRNNE